jgi:hypothetical protein
MPIVYNSSDEIRKIYNHIKDTRKNYFESNKETNSLVLTKLNTPFEKIEACIGDFLPYQKGFNLNKKRFTQKICRDEEFRET